MKHSKTSRFLSAVLAMLMVFTMFPVTAFAATANYTWEKVDFADITPADSIMITMTNAGGVTYALPNNAAQKNPAYKVSVSGSAIVTETDIYGWTIEESEGKYTISAGGNYLYAYSENNGVRVGSEKGLWTLDGNY
ncbi:MAG: hypothetical protein IJE28_09670, partial [Oscillospiraceae bacterium]|nr:hypothetical protein [Oscillospiraceae bacterium]